MTDKKELAVNHYLHLYIGCEVETSLGVFTLIGIEDGAICHNKTYGRKVFGFKNVKPILRPLSDMTEEERKAVYGNFGQLGLHEKPSNIDYFKPEGLRYMLGKNIDLFNLIESGLAIDATTINNQTINHKY